jgi:hypothetical protein
MESHILCDTYFFEYHDIYEISTKPRGRDRKATRIVDDLDIIWRYIGNIYTPGN